MALRKRNSPGIEINEIDRSQYDKQTDYSLPNAPVCLITGFADKGENYKTQWINSKNTFIEKYGYPTNTVEQYFFNASMEILNRNGILLTNKFPYKNEAKDKFSYIEYNISTPISILDNENKHVYEKISDIKTNLMHLLDDLHIDYDESNIDSIKKILETINDLCENSQIVKLDDKAEIQDLYKKIEDLYELLTNSSDKFYQIYVNDSALTSYIRIDLNETKAEDNLMDLNTLDKFITSKYNATNTNKITIVDIQQNKYEKSNLPHSVIYYDNEVENCPFLGIVPVIVSPANALYYQKLLSNKNGNYTKLVDFRNYNIISKFKVRKNKKINQETFNESYFTVPLASTCSIFDENEYDNSLSKQLAKYFPTITYNSNNTFDKEHMKKIGIVVLKAYNDTANNNTINFEVVESFVGSLNKNAKNPITNANEFIDNIVNSQSQYINVFTAIEDDLLNKASFVASNNQNIMSLGFHRHECKKIIDYTESIIQPMNKMFGILNNTTTSNIDIIVDAGMSNIAQYLTDNKKENMSFDNNQTIQLTKENLGKWHTVSKMFDEFCKFTRKDCIFLNDIPRPFCLDGNQKIVRYTNPSNTIENSILTKLKQIININSSYSAGYSDWFYCKDEYTGDFFWCPPSIKAAGIFCYTDIYFHKWDAPAGMNRGIVQGAYDVAFSPNNDEAGRIYQQAWNYAINYPINGIVLEGQKTFQRNATALDRINVRRLMLYLEKRTAQIAKQFLYEGNTSYLRMKLVDLLSPIFEDAKNGNGIVDYIIKCDETNNTPITIDRNELHVAIAVKPVKTVEYIIVNFIVTNQSANITEEIKRI